MTMNQINYFLAIVECGTFSSAAAEMYISQSSLSKQIKALETELGVQLFSRAENPISITPAGRIFYEFAKTSEIRHQELMLNLLPFQQTSLQTLSLGVLPVMYSYGLASHLARFKKQNQMVRIDMLEREQGDLLRLMENGDIELCVLRTDLLSSRDYEMIPLVEDEVFLVCKHNNPFAKLDSVSFSMLHNQHLLMFDKTSSIRQLCEKRFQAAGYQPDTIRCTSGNHPPLLSMAAEGLGIALLPGKLLSPDHLRTLCCVPLQEPIRTVTSLVRLRKKKHSATSDLFFAHFEKIRLPLA